MEEHMITWQQSEYRVGPEEHDDLHHHLRDPFCLFTKMAVVCLEMERPTWRLCSLLVARFTHQRSSSWTRFRDEAHLQYKNRVQQFSCHSKHSYLSFNGPVTSAAIQKTNKQTKRQNQLYKAKIEIRVLKPENLSNICSELAHEQPVRGGTIENQH